MAYRQQNFDLVYGIVVGGDADDPDPAQSGAFRVHIPGQYGNNVKREDLPFARGLAQGTQEGVTRFNPPPERGTGVILAKRTGESGSGELICVGTVAGEMGGGGSTPGNLELFKFLNTIEESFKHDKKTPRTRPKGLKEVMDKGALVKEAIEAGKNWKNEDHFGMLTSTALPQLLALFMDNKTNIATAKTPYASILTSAMQNGLAGGFMNIADMFSNLTDEQSNAINSKLDQQLQKSLQNIISLMQYTEPAVSDGSISGTRVNQKVFIANMLQLFADRDVKNVSDLVDIFTELLSNPEQWGCDLLDQVIAIAEDAFGAANVSISPCGNDIEIQQSDTAQKAAQALSSLMSSASSFPSAMPGTNFFGDSSKIMQEMIGRLPQDQMKIATEQLQKHVAPGTDPRKKNNQYLLSQFFNGFLMG